MINKLRNFKIYLESSYLSKALDIILVNSLDYHKLNFEKNGDAVLTVPSSLRDVYKSLFDSYCIESRFSKDFGIGEILYRYKKRYGIFIGLFLMISIIYASSLFVWDIRIEGNSKTDISTIMDILNECGFSQGSYIPNVDYDKLHNEFLLKSDTISWISVNIEGNVANVLVKENLKGQADSKNSYSNVVAKCDGQIRLVRVFDGVKTVKILDVVRKGDILISGVIDSQSEGVRYVHADGVVNAYVNKHISVKIPMKDKIKTSSGVLYTDNYIKIFSKSINILKKGRNLDGQYDKIEESKPVVLFNKIKLPITLYEVKYFEYKYEDITYSEKEAKERALIKLREELDLALENAELISKKINYYCDYEFYYIECDLYCIEDIAEVVEFHVVEK